jgi:hypothetical protein
MKKNAMTFLEEHREELGFSTHAIETFEGM